MKKIAIIGANEAITLLINKAKDLGYETHVFAWECGDPGESVADFFYPISIDEKELILQKCKEINVDGVCSITSDLASPTVNYVARKLKLNSNLPEAEILARDKYQMRCAFRNAGIFTPKFYEATAEYDVYELADNIGFPMIVKPTDRWSSKGVNRVNSISELKDALDIAINESLNNKAIVEEFIEGDEYSAECICYNGEYHILAYTQKYTTGFPHYIETGHYQPALLDERIQKECVEVFSIALEALGIINGAAHIEFKVDSMGRICIIEIGARMGGDCIGTFLTPISTGMDYVRMVIDVACGNPPCFDKISKPVSVEVKFIVNIQDYIDIFKQKVALPDKVIQVGNIDFEFSRDVIDSSTRHGCFVIKR